jgi:alkylhydroperoxidase family enzyme
VSWLPTRADSATPLDRVFGLRPNRYADLRALLAVFVERRLVDPVVLELCRLRLAQLLGCGSELAVRWQPAADAGLDEAKVAALALWPSHPSFTDGERACLTVAERFVLDPHGLTDDEAGPRSTLGSMH